MNKNRIRAMAAVFVAIIATRAFSYLNQDIGTLDLPELFAQISGYVFYFSCLSVVYVLAYHKTTNNDNTHIRYEKLPERLPANSGKRAGFVYVVKELTGKYYKIGRTVDPSDRIKTFEVKLPMRVEYVLLLPTDDMYKLESSLHTLYASKHVNGEWFVLNANDINNMRNMFVEGDHND